MVGQHRDQHVGEHGQEPAARPVGRVQSGGRGQGQPVVALVAGHGGGGLPAVHARTLVPVVVSHPRHLGQLGMHPGQVVVLLEVLRDQLPVGGHFQTHLLADPPPVQAVAGRPLRQVAQPSVQGRGLGIEAGEHQRAPLVHPDWQQRVVGGVKAGSGHLAEAGD